MWVRREGGRAGTWGLGAGNVFGKEDSNKPSVRAGRRHGVALDAWQLSLGVAPLLILATAAGAFGTQRSRAFTAVGKVVGCRGEFPALNQRQNLPLRIALSSAS